MLTKFAEVVLKEHQQRTIDKLFTPSTPGVIAYHNVGSGKTLTSLKAVERSQAENPGKSVVFIAPASLLDNVHKEIAKHGLDIDMSRLQVLSYDKAANRIDELEKLDPSLVVIDEAHNLRNTNTTRYKRLSRILGKADKNLLLTGTMAYNNAHDLASLINLSAKQKVLPSEKREFDAKYIHRTEKYPSVWKRLIRKDGRTEENLKNTPTLKRVLGKYVDYHDAATANPEDYPTKVEQEISVEMDPKQLKIYNFLMGSVRPELRRKIEGGLPPTKRDAHDLNAFVTGFRQVSNSATPYESDGEPHISPKIQEAVDRLSSRMNVQPGHRAVVYSNYIDAGLRPYESALSQKGIKPIVFTGGLSRKEKKEIVDDFNKNPKDSKVLLLSSSGGEGLDLKGVRSVQVLEPHWNKSKIDQVIGRAARYKSHAHLPEDQRDVLIEHFHTKHPRTWLDKLLLRSESSKKTIDPYLYEYSREKDRLVGQMKDLLRE